MQSYAHKKVISYLLFQSENFIEFPVCCAPDCAGASSKVHALVQPNRVPQRGHAAEGPINDANISSDSVECAH